jgi:RNA polymerase sigma-70 factor (ECF subfamily)
VNSWRKAKNRLAAHHRAGRRREQPAPSPDGLALVSALQKIPKAQRQVIVLYHVADLSIDEIAQELGAPTGTIKARLARGRKALAPLVAEFDDEPRRSRPVSQPHHIRPEWETSNHA